MDYEDDVAKNDAFALAEDLSRYSLEELERRIAVLEQEIELTRAEIVNKSSTKQAADAVFKI